MQGQHTYALIQFPLPGFGLHSGPIKNGQQTPLRKKHRESRNTNRRQLHMTHAVRTSTAILALSLGMAGLASAETVVDFTTAEYNSKTGPYFQKVADAFQAENPDIKINIEVVP